MNARCFLLPAIIVAIFAVSCSPAEELPVAPPPRPAKTNAELLVGKWKLTQLDKQPTGDDLVFEFTKDGKFTGHASGPTISTQKRTGTYTLRENSLLLAIEANDKEPGENSEHPIDSLTETELVTRASPDSKRQFVFKRVETK